MAYTPQNLSVFLAAFAGAVAGMAESGRFNTSSTAADYDTLVAAAGAFAQRLDTVRGAAATNEFQLANLAEASEGVFLGSNNTSATPATYANQAASALAVATSAGNYLTAQGITPPSGGGFVVGPTASASNTNRVPIFTDATGQVLGLSNITSDPATTYAVITASTAVTNSVVSAARLNVDSSGAAASGLGVRISWQVEATTLADAWVTRTGNADEGIFNISVAETVAGQRTAFTIRGDLGGAQILNSYSADNNAPQLVTTFVANTSVNMIDGFGGRIDFNATDDAATGQWFRYGWTRNGSDNTGTFTHTAFTDVTNTLVDSWIWLIDSTGAPASGLGQRFSMDVEGNNLAQWSVARNANADEGLLTWSVAQTAAGQRAFLTADGSLGGLVEISSYSAATNAVQNALRLTAVTSADMIDGFGGQIVLRATDSGVTSNWFSLLWQRAGADNTGTFQLNAIVGGLSTTIFEHAGNTGISTLSGANGVRLASDNGAQLTNAALAPFVEAKLVAVGRNVVSLCRGATVTTTQMPANTGNGVVYVANANVLPTAAADAVDGGILFSDGQSKLTFKGGGIAVWPSGGTAKPLTLADDDASASVNFRAAATVTNEYTMVLPPTWGADGDALRIQSGGGTATLTMHWAA